jgi:peptidoglycan hydrolase-like protein with peptidoglycan-binding domain
LAGLFLISGCATTSKSADLEAQGLRNQITLLEAQIQAKDAEINTLKESLSQVQERIRAQARLDEAKPIKPDETVFEQPSVRQVQTALKNAGYYVGRIDGLMGARSREALRGFQADHNLRANGKINRKTWSLLRAYLNRVPLKPAVKSSG